MTDKAKGRTKVANGESLFLERVDGRTTLGRRFKELYLQIIADLGGDDNTSEGQRQLARRAAMLSMRCEAMEADFAAGGSGDLQDYLKATNMLSRLLGTLGLRRRAKSVPSKPSDPHAAAILDGED